MAKDKFRVVAENVTVFGHRKGDDDFELPEEGYYNIEALIAAGIIERADSEKGSK